MFDLTRGRHRQLRQHRCCHFILGRMRVAPASGLVGLSGNRGRPFDGRIAGPALSLRTRRCRRFVFRSGAVGLQLRQEPFAIKGTRVLDPDQEGRQSFHFGLQRGSVCRRRLDFVDALPGTASSGQRRQLRFRDSTHGLFVDDLTRHAALVVSTIAKDERESADRAIGKGNVRAGSRRI